MVFTLYSLLLALCGAFLIVSGKLIVEKQGYKFVRYVKLKGIFAVITVGAFVLYSPQVTSAFITSALIGSSEALALISGSLLCVFAIILPLLYLYKPYFVDREYLKLEIPAVILSLLLYYVLSLNRVYGPISAFIFLGFFINFKIALYFKKRNTEEALASQPMPASKCISCFTLGLFGALVIFTGAGLLVYSVKGFGAFLGIKKYTLYFFILPVVLSISLLTTVFIRLKRGERVENVVEKLFHSAIYSFLFSLGLLSSIKSIVIPLEAMKTYNYMTIGFPLAFLAFLLPNLRLSRLKCAILILSYFFFMVLFFAHT